MRLAELRQWVGSVEQKAAIAREFGIRSIKLLRLQVALFGGRNPWYIENALEK